MKPPAVLVVEDNAISRKLARVALEAEGYRVLEAPDAGTALAHASAAPPDLILQDLLLPDMDGFELVRRLRALPGCATVPIVAVSGFLSRAEEAQVTSTGFDDFLGKPLEPSRLVETVRAFLPVPEGVEDVTAGPRVLVADDDAVQLRLARVRLTLAGFRVTTAPDGLAALEAARADPPDAVLSDVLMPGMDGFRLCLALRADQRLRRVPVVLVTASFLEESDRRLAEEVGANAFVLRTPDLAEAIAALRSSLGAEPPMPRPGATSPDARHVDHVVRRMEHQAALSGRLAQRCAVQAAALSVLSGIAETLARTDDIGVILRDVLARCVAAGGLSRGALYLVGRDGVPRLEAWSGYPEEAVPRLATCFGQEELCRQVLANQTPVAFPSAAIPENTTRSFLTGADAASAVAVPIVSHGECLGLLLLASRARELEEQDWLAFARTVASQVGQALALAKAFGRVAASERRYRDLMESANDAILVLDLRGTVLEVNQQVERLAGRPRAEIVGRPYTDLIPEAEQTDSAGRFAQLLREGSVRTGHRHIQRPGGEHVPVELSSAVVETEGENVVLTIIRDLSERRRAEETLLKLGAAVEQTADSVTITDLAGVIEYVNPAFEAQTGFRREEVLGRKASLLKSGAHDPSFFQELWATILAGRPFRAVFTNRRKTGEIFYEEKTITPITDPEGRITHFVSTGRDITERRRAEDALRESEERYRSLFDRNLAGVYRRHLDGRIVECNEALARIYGYASREDILTHNATGPYPSSEEREAFMARLKAEGVLVNHESQDRRKDGKPVWILENATLVELAPPGLIEGTVVDITERKRLEEQLRQSQKMEAIGQLAGGVAHDFNNLLSVVLGYSDLLLRDLGPQHPGRARVEQIAKAADGAAALTRQLLAFSRKQILQPKLLDLNAVLADIEKMLRRLIGEDVQLVTVFAEGLGRVMADPGQMEQVIVNLAVNARDAMPEGGKLTLETSNVEIDEAYAAAHAGARPGPHAMLAVSDTGHGMDAETLSRIFEPFFTTKEAGKGTGLGLSTVYGIVKQSGGHVAAYSEPGRGTTFKVYLPRVEGEPERLARGNATEQTVRGGSETILLAEDDEALREIVRETLEAGGYTVLGGAPSEEVLRAARSHSGPIHLMLTDVVMPGMSGRELAGRVQTVQPGARVLFMSGYTDEAISHHGVLDAGVHFIQKPFTPEALLRKLRELLDAPAEG